MKSQRLLYSMCIFAAMGLYSCSDDSGSTSSEEKAICGNGILEEDELCDDGNTEAGDGCSDDCTVEAGWTCDKPGIPCTEDGPDKKAVCGDGKITGDESCDDGNTKAGDGCSGDCAVEDGWRCPTPGEPCIERIEEEDAVCGDGLLDGSEICDDGNIESGDGCSSECRIEDGWNCETPGAACEKTNIAEAVCGDGIVADYEECDDGNAEADDGCSSNCALETGWQCETPGQPCVKDVVIDAVCGDGQKADNESCDDGNLDAEDGCAPDCTIEEGWSCDKPGEPCVQVSTVPEDVCGDGEITGDEKCDDGNAKAGDGCSDNCAIEAGWVCDNPGTPCTKQPVVPGDVCGDGKISGNEKCDDGNAKDGDGCSAKCAIENGWTCAEAGKACSTVCGDGIVAGKEKCDDGNTKADDGCSAKCAIEESYVCKTAGKPCTPEFDNKTSIKILGVGNSLMRDSTVYLCDILVNMGYKNVTVGVLYTGGKSINYHAENMRKKGSPGTYFLSTCKDCDTKSKCTETTPKKTYLEAIKSAKWDYFIMMTSPSGVIDLYNKDIDYVIDTVKKNSPKEPEFGWALTWAYQTGVSHYQMAFHGYNQIKMYEAAVMSVKTKIEPRKDISFVIPAGTAIQNLRNGIFANNMNRDGYHMSYNNGRFAANLMWAKQITKRPVGKVTYKPNKYSYTDRQIKALKEAVVNAYKTPYAVTRPSKGVNGTYVKPNKDLQKIFSDAGHNLKDYVEIPVGVTTKALYNSTKQDADVCNLTSVLIDGTKYCYATLVSAETGSKSADLKKHAASRIFTRYEIPNGSFIVIKSGYEYRADGWISFDKATTAKNRPAVVDKQITEVTDKWWGKYQYRAFTLSKKGEPKLSDEEMESLEKVMSIFVPIHHDNADDALVKAGYDLSKYKKLDLSLTHKAYWNSNTVSDLPTGLTRPDANNKFPTKLFGGDKNSTAAKFATTRIFTKSAIPNGSLIVLVKGYRYTPDGWKALDVSNKGTDLRPKPVVAKDANSITVVDDKWWGQFKYRAFNITKAEPVELTPLEQYQMGEVFAIYTPVSK